MADYKLPIGLGGLFKKLHDWGDGTHGDQVYIGGGAPLSLTPGGAGRDLTLKFQRPANVDAYLAGDVVWGVMDFPLPDGAGEYMIMSAALMIYRTTIPAGMTTFKLKFYKVTPPSALADNAPWVLAAADQDAYLGELSFGAPAVVGTAPSAALFTQKDGVNVAVKATGADLWAYLVTDGPFTPAASTDKRIDLHVVKL